MSRTYRHVAREHLFSLYTNGPIDNKQLFKIGYAETCNPNTFTVDVRIDGIDTVESCPVLNLVGRPIGSDLVWLQSLRGSYVILINILGIYHVLSTFPGNQNHRDELTEATVGLSDGSVKPDGFEKLYFRDYNQNRPNDFLVDDKIIRTEDGVELGLFRGGVAKLKASPMAQLVLGKIKDFARLVARQFSIFCDFGQIRSYQTEEGRTTLHIQGGAVFEEETHPEQKKWTVEAWFGDYPPNPDTRFMIQTSSQEIEDPDLHQYTVQSANIHGQIGLETTDDLAHQVGKTFNQIIGYDKLSTVHNDYFQLVERNFGLDVLNEATISADKGVFILSPQDSVSVTSGKRVTLTGGDEARLTSKRVVNIFSENEVNVGIDNMNNLTITPLGVFVTDDGIKKKPFFLPDGVLGGAGPIQTGFTDGAIPSVLSVGAAASSESIPGEIGKEGDLVISLSELGKRKIGEEQEEEYVDIYIAASPTMYIRISKEEELIRLQGSLTSYIEITPEGVSISGMVGDPEGPLV